MSKTFTLSSGIYTLPDAAKILELPLPKLRRWVAGTWTGVGDRVEEPRRRYAVGSYFSEGQSRERHFDFHTLIELFTVAQLRTKGVTARTIRRARDELAARFHTPFPFALEGLLASGRKLLKELGDDVLLELSSGGQTALEGVILPFCERLEFDEATQLALRFAPLGRERAVLVDARKAFGRPAVKGTNITTEALAALIRGGETIESVADDFSLPIAHVKDAWEFENRRAA